MPELKKLEIGESYTLTVVRVTEVKTGKWPEYHWLGADGVTVVTPKAAADRQLEKRLKMTLQTVEQETITIHRAPNLEDAAKSWWNFDIAAAHEAQPKPASKRVPSPVPGEAPPSFHRSAPLPPDPEGPFLGAGGLDGPEGDGDSLDHATRERLARYTALAREIAAFQKELSTLHDMPFDGSSVNAMTATIWINK